MVPWGPPQEITSVELVSTDRELRVCVNPSRLCWQPEPFGDQGIPCGSWPSLVLTGIPGFACCFLKMLNGEIMVATSLKCCED